MSTLPLSTGAEAVATDRLRFRVRPWRLRAWVGTNASVAYSLADQIVYSFGNMMVAALVSRYCGQRQFGIYILTQRALDLLMQLCNVFLWGPCSFHLSGMSGQAQRVYQGSILQLQIVCCVLFAGGLWLTSHSTAGLAHADIHQAFAPLVIASTTILFREFTRRMYFAQMRMREAFWTETATVALQISGVVWLAWKKHLDVPGALQVLGIGALLVSLWWVFKDGRRVRLGLRSAGQDLRRNLKLGRWFLGSNMVFVASSQCNPWILGTLLGGSSVGAYAVCESVVNIPRVALTSMQNTMAPTIAAAYAKEGKQGVRRTVARFDRGLLLVALCCALVLFLSGPYVAKLIFHVWPADSRLLLGLLILNLVAFACALAQSYGLTALGRADTTFYVNALGLAIQAVACIAWVHKRGAPGAAAAMLLGSVVVVLLRRMVYSRELAQA